MKRLPTSSATNTYATNRNVLAPAGMGDDSLCRLNALAVTLAREAREQSATSNPVLIAGSISTGAPDPDSTLAAAAST